MFLTLFLMVISVRENEAAPELTNWTTCDEFLNGTTFDPTLIVDVYWKIFYFWHIEYEKSYQIRFSAPSDELIRRFKVELDGNIKPPVVWSEAEFFMESSIDISALYIRTNISGLYRIIPAYAIKMESIPLFLVAMKLIEPGYLGLMNCKHRLCYALAPVERMPPDAELEEIARRFDFRGDFNYTHVNASSMPVTPPSQDFHDVGDQNDEILEDLDQFNIL